MATGGCRGGDGGSTEAATRADGEVLGAKVGCVMGNGHGENTFSMCQGGKDDTGGHSGVGRHHCDGGVEIVPAGMSGNGVVRAHARVVTCATLGN
jgi:hypothetical protein